MICNFSRLKIQLIYKFKFLLIIHIQDLFSRPLNREKKDFMEAMSQDKFHSLHESHCQCEIVNIKLVFKIRLLNYFLSQD